LRPEEIAQLLERWRPKVLREMGRRRLWRGMPRVEYDDHFQEVALVLYTRCFESEEHLYRALWTGLGFRARDFWKAGRRREIPYGDMFGAEAPAPSVDGVEDHGRVVADARHVEDCLSDLDERERAVYRLIRGEELSRRKAAKALGIKEADVLRALYSAQQKVDRFVLLFISRRLCASRTPAVRGLARSDAEPREVRQARAHLAHCSDCLVAYREYRAALSEQIASVLPAPVVAASSMSQADGLIATVRELADAAKRQLCVLSGRGPNTGTAAEAAAGAGAGGAVSTKLVVALCMTATAGGGAICVDRFDPFAGAPPAKREATEARQPRQKPKTEPAAVRAATHDPPPAPTATTQTKSTPSKSSSSATRQTSPSSSQSQQEFFDAPNSSAAAPSSVQSASSDGGGSSSGGSSGSSSGGGGGEFFGE
jgi:RNA polymerase sigma factor (sigma-70 family)